MTPIEDPYLAGEPLKSVDKVLGESIIAIEDNIDEPVAEVKEAIFSVDSGHSLAPVV